MDTPGSDPAATPTAFPPPGFTTSRRGFDQAQVLEYIGRLTDRLQTVENLERGLRSELQRAQQERDALVRERDALVQQRDDALQVRDTALRDRASVDAATYEQASERVTELLMALDREVDKARTDAEAEAERTVAEARDEADRVRREAEEARNAAAYEAKQAREEGERSVAALTEQREGILGELKGTCSNFLEVIGGLAASIGHGEDETRSEDSEDEAAPSMPASKDGTDRTVVLPDVLPERPA
jgi:chromosome segregation ATPase